MNGLLLAAMLVFTYTSESGTQCYTDDPKRIPAKYQANAEEITIGEWRDYPKLSIVEPAPPVQEAIRPADAPLELPLNSHRYVVHPDGAIEVQPAETLGHFADWLEVSTASLRNRNRLSYGSVLPIGTRLQLDTANPVVGDDQPGPLCRRFRVFVQRQVTCRDVQEVKRGNQRFGQFGLPGRDAQTLVDLTERAQLLSEHKALIGLFPLRGVRN